MGREERWELARGDGVERCEDGGREGRGEAGTAKEDKFMLTLSQRRLIRRKLIT